MSAESLAEVLMEAPGLYRSREVYVPLDEAVDCGTLIELEGKTWVVVHVCAAYSGGVDRRVIVRSADDPAL